MASIMVYFGRELGFDVKPPLWRHRGFIRSQLNQDKMRLTSDSF